MATPPYFGGGIGFPDPLGGAVNYPASGGSGSTSNPSFFNSPLFSGILSGLGGLATGILGNQAANAQADAATNASNSSNALLSSIYQQQRTDAAPYTLAGYGAVGRLQDMFGLNPQRYIGTATAPSVPQIDNSQFPLGRGSVSDPSIGYSGGVAYPIGDGSTSPRIFANADGTPVQDFGGGGVGSNLPTLADLTGTAAAPTSTAQAAPNGGQLPADFGSMTHNFSLADFNLDPGYAFRQSEGAKGVERSAAARGSLLGGGTLKALDRYNQDYASNEFNNAFNRYQVNRSNQINPLFSLAGLGQTSAGQVASSGTSLGNNAANINFTGGVDAGAARASGYASTANAINSGISNTLYSLKNLGRG